MAHARKPSDVGPEALGRLFQGLRIDEEWSVRNGREFSWWGHRLRQTVAAGEPVRSRGVETCRVSVRTDLARDVVLSPRLEEVVSLLNAHGGLSAVVLDREARKVFLSAHMTLHEGSLDWGCSLLLSAAVTQGVEASILAERLDLIVAGKVDESAHPSSGPREVPDEMLLVVEQVFVPIGRRPSAFEEREFDELAAVETGPSVMSNASGGALVAELPYSGATPAVVQLTQDSGGEPETALFQASATEKHPRYGSGCLILLMLPADGVVAATANTLNLAEARGTHAGYGFGAWCVNDDKAVHVCFLPSAVHRPGLLQAMMNGDALRALWARDALKVSGAGSPVTPA